MTITGKEKKGKGKGKGAGKGKGKGKKQDREWQMAMPRELLPHGVPHTDANESLCFGYNCRGGCSDAGTGAACDKGWHLCCYKGCFGTHPYYEHGQQ